MSNVVEFVIVDGQNKFELLQQLPLIGLHDDDGKRVSKTFRVTGHIKGLSGKLSTSEEHLCVNGIKAEDGSGESWLIEGYYPARSHANGFTTRGGTFEGYYNTRSRSGHLKITFN